MSRHDHEENEGPTMSFGRYNETKADRKQRIEIKKMRMARVINRARIHAAVRGRPLAAIQLQTMSQRHATAFAAAMMSTDEAYAERMARLAAKAKRLKMHTRAARRAA